MAERPPETPRHDFGGARLLVIDDEDGVRRIVRRMLGDCNCRIVEAADGSEGLTILEREPLDLVLTDLAMPRISGFAVLESLALRRPDLPVIVMSGNGAAMAMARDVPVLRKPFTAAELLGIVADYLARSRSARSDLGRPPSPAVRVVPRSRYRSPPR